MRSIQAMLALTSAMLALTVLAPQTSRAQDSGEAKDSRESRSLSVTKECGTATLASGELGYCTILESNFRPLRGAKIRYSAQGSSRRIIHSSIAVSSSRAHKAAAAPRLAIASSGACRMSWEPASSPGERIAAGVQSRCNRYHGRRLDLALEGRLIE